MKPKENLTLLQGLHCIEEHFQKQTLIKGITSILDNAYITSKQIHDIPLEKFYKEKRIESLNLSDETLKYLYQLN